MAVGAHPGYPDLVGFGWRELGATPDDVYADVLYQLGALTAFLRSLNTAKSLHAAKLHPAKLHHVKAHGALYLKMLRDAPTAEAVVVAVRDFDADVPLVVLAGPGGALMAEAAAAAGVGVVLEAFPDRAYLDDGRLAPRSVKDAVLHDPARIAARALEMAQGGGVVSLSGKRIPLAVQTLCLHGDTPHAAAAARAVRAALTSAGIAVRAF